VFSDEEVRRLFAAIDAQRMSSYSNKAIVDPVLFRVLYDTGLRISEALKLTVSDVDTRAGTLRIRDSKNGAGRTIPITGRLAGPWTRTSRPRTRPPSPATPCSTQGPGQTDQPGDHLHAVSWLPG
jgi:Site-specific recombinase XerD